MGLAFTFAEVRIDGPLKDDWDILLRLVGPFQVRLDGLTIYQEGEFCLVEFASQLNVWIQSGPDLDFSYDSEESDVLGLLRFKKKHGGAWEITFAHRSEKHLVPEADLKQAAQLYLTSLRKRLLPIVDLAEFLSAEMERMSRCSRGIPTGPKMTGVSTRRVKEE